MNNYYHQVNRRSFCELGEGKNLKEQRKYFFNKAQRLSVNGNPIELLLKSSFRI